MKNKRVDHINNIMSPSQYFYRKLKEIVFQRQAKLNLPEFEFDKF